MNMLRSTRFSSPLLGLALAGLGAMTVLGFSSPQGAPAAAPKDAKVAVNHYIGAQKCKNCHQADAMGNQYAAWQHMKHSKAFEVLATDEAKKVAAERKIEDAQKADECLRCHTTAFGVPKEQIGKGFDPKLGVQCETCHGPGEAHMKARFAAAAAAGDQAADKPYAAPPEGEIVTSPPQSTCLACHNKDSPNYKPLCYHKAMAEIRHLDPRRPHPEGSLLECKAEKCICVDMCTDSACPCPQKKKK
jgi:hypothetical protein